MARLKHTCICSTSYNVPERFLFCSKTIGGCVLRTLGGWPSKARKSMRLAKILGGRLVMLCNIHLGGAADAQGAGGWVTANRLLTGNRRLKLV